MDIVRDPVCGELIKWQKAAGNFPYNGRFYWFRSRKCLENFFLYPARFAG
ncbi:MAG: YHS domain-containing protein [Deltaproteobacteria bacterium]|nr:YHS domain-containing protein [Deltaproteobacteria bacterium]TLN00723.1 MAG: YHS domain-containing protein [bacterium]